MAFGGDGTTFSAALEVIESHYSFVGILQLWTYADALRGALPWFVFVRRLLKLLREAAKTSSSLFVVGGAELSVARIE
jgi:hypothetical protein